MLKTNRQQRKNRIRAKIKGIKDKPRMSVYRSNKYIYVQLIDDVSGSTLASAKGIKAQDVGEEIAQKAKKAKITKVVFDRSGYQYHGKVQILADAARKGGLEF